MAGETDLERLIQKDQEVTFLISISFALDVSWDKSGLESLCRKKANVDSKNFFTR